MKQHLRLAVYLASAFVLGAATISTLSFRSAESSEVPYTITEERKVQYKWHAPDLPKSLSFAGEKVPLDREDVREALDRELLYNYFNQSSTIRILKLSNRYFPIIEPILKAHGIPEDFKYLAVAESALQNQTSRVGAGGFWQFMPKTAPEFGLELSDDVDERNHIIKSTIAAAKYLKQAHSRFGSWTVAAATYNMGQGGFDRRSDFQGVKDYYSVQLPEETMRYVHRILAFKLLIGQPEHYGYIVSEHESYKPYKTKKVNVSSSIPNLADFALQHGTNYKKLKELNPWLTSTKLNVKSGKSYEIEVPES